MFDIKKYNDNQKKIKEFDDKIKLLEALKKDVKSLKDNFQDNCNHDLVLVYNYNLSEGREAMCLFCDQYFSLDSNNFDFFTEKEIDENNIIDVTPFVCEKIQKTTKNGKNILFLKAHEKLNEIMSLTSKISKKDVKDMILDDIISYNIEKSQKRLKKTL